MSCSVCAGYSSYNCPCCGEDVRMMTCPDCKGTGLTPFRLFNIKTRGVVEVSANMYYSYPKDEDSAEEKGEFLCRIPREECPTCHGEGEIPEDY